MKTRHITPILSGLAITCLVALSSGCTTVEFYEKEQLSGKLMTLEGSGTEAHFYQKTYYSMEGSAGGIGTSAGGGCGCY